MDQSIRPAGWTPFGGTRRAPPLFFEGLLSLFPSRPTIFNTTFYAEFNSTGMSCTPDYRSVKLILRLQGPGGNTSSRIPLEHILNATSAKEFALEKVFAGLPSWIDSGYLF